MKLDKCYFICVILVFAVFSSIAGEKNISGRLNVKDFGAKGDGKHDDSNAIQRCLNEAAADKYSSYGIFVTAPEVYFPKGTYLISRTLIVPPCKKTGFSFINLRGEQAIIKQRYSNRDIFYMRFAYRNLIEGLTFDGGRRQIKIWTRNKDKAQIMIRNCIFRASSGPAIDDQLRCDPRILRPNWGSDIMEPYFILPGSNGDLALLSSRDEKQWRIASYASTLFRITRCSFERCQQVMSVWADWTLFDNSKIETDPDMKGAAIIAGGTLLMENIEGLGRDDPSEEQWWITLDARRTFYPGYGNASIDLRNVRLKTDSKNGWCVVRNEAEFRPYARLTAIHADNSTFQSTGSEEVSIIHLMEIPNQIVIRNCKELTGKNTTLFSYGQDFTNYFERTAKKYKRTKAQIKDDIALHFENNVNLKTKLPDSCSQYITNNSNPRFNKAACRFMYGSKQFPSIAEVRAKIVKSFNVKDFGANGKINGDDTSAFLKALSLITREKVICELIIPNGIYVINKTLKLPVNIVIRGVGFVIITQKRGMNIPVFSASRARLILIQDINFFKCKTTIRSLTKTEDRSTLLIDNCSFNWFRVTPGEIRDFPVYCVVENENFLVENNSRVSISECMFDNSQALLNNFQHALIENSWITCDATMRNRGVIVNKGNIHIKSILTVPRTKARTHDGKVIDTSNTDMRLFNNYNNIYIDRCRLGNESGGLPVVVNLNDQGTVLLQNNWMSMRERSPGNPARNTFIDCEKIPDAIILSGNRGYPTVMLSIPKNSHEKLKGRFGEIGNALPKLIKEKN